MPVLKLSTELCPLPAAIQLARRMAAAIEPPVCGEFGVSVIGIRFVWQFLFCVEARLTPGLKR